MGTPEDVATEIFFTPPNNCLSWNEKDECCDDGYPVTCPYVDECAGVPKEFLNQKGI